MFVASTPIIDRQEIVHPIQVINEIAEMNKIGIDFVLDILGLLFKDSRAHFHNDLLFKWENLRLVPMRIGEAKDSLSVFKDFFETYNNFDDVIAVGFPKVLASIDFKRLTRWSDYDRKCRKKKMQIDYFVRMRNVKKYIDFETRRDQEYKPEGWFLIKPIKVVVLKEKPIRNYRDIGYKLKNKLYYFWDIRKNIKLPLSTVNNIAYAHIPSVFFKRTSTGLFFKSQGLSVPDYLEDLSINILEEHNKRKPKLQASELYQKINIYQENHYEISELRKKLSDAEEQIAILENELEEMAKNALKTTAMAKIIKTLVIDKYGEKEAKRIQYFGDQGISEVINTLKEKQLYGKTFSTYFKLPDYLSAVNDVIQAIEEDTKDADLLKY